MTCAELLWQVASVPRSLTVSVARLQLLDNTLTPYPGQIGNGEQAALLASNGDGIHSLGASFGPLIKGNKLVNLGDDGITVHGLFFLVIKVSGVRLTLQSAYI